MILVNLVRNTREVKLRRSAAATYERNKDKRRATIRAWAMANPGKVRGARLKLRYGITNEQYEEMLREQDGVCAICHRVCATGLALGVDHDHVTGAVRGLLCRNCNHGIAKFRESPELFAAAARYVLKYRK